MFDFVQNNRLALQVILGAVALTFVGFGVGSYTSAVDDPYLAKVDKVKIYKKDLDRALEGQPADAATRQAALENLIRQELLLAEGRHQGLSASPEALRQVIASLPVLQENGRFSEARYREFLANRNLTPQAFEAQIAREVVLKEQLLPFLDGQFVSRTQVAQVARLMGESRVLKLALLKPEAFAGELKLDDAALKAYYSANAKRFKSPEAVKLEYLVLSQEALAARQNVSDAEVAKYLQDHAGDVGKEERRASHILLTVPAGAKPADKAKVKMDADAILKDVRANPAKFAELAKARSQDPGSAVKGGDLGFFAQGMMVKPFNDAVFSLKPGQISDLVETEFGYHIIRLDEVKAPDQTAARAEAAERIKRQKASAAFRAEVEKLGDLVYQQGTSLKPAADALGLKVESADWLVKGDKNVVRPLFAHPKLLEAAFSDEVVKKKQNSEPVDVGNNTVVVIRAVEHRPERAQAIDEVKDVIRAELVAREGAKLAEARGKAMLADLKAGKPVAGLSWADAGEVSRRAPGSLSIAELREAFSVPVKNVPAYAGAKRDNGEYVLINVVGVNAPKAADPAEGPQIAALLGEVSANAQATSYLGLLREKYKVTVSQQPAE
ncbi:SurA N-terminal domain-containing protein [Crenobacter cavernae]|uniref:Periplasmic chaperone PpiD n=1 Tax=Crenobacter cavernae TaxID=2290923 RepID=A0A345Y8I4_9NEIS|nr:SurA N-terminal domain-containing protein [Crenobacter cavernae]AXK40236.1 peptidylprolyl isomerase [Crenobacter cavernae]